MRWMWTRAVMAAAVGLIAGGAVGCAQERPPINRVQPNALAKSFFVGASLADPSDDPEFYSRPTLIDVGYGAAQDGMFTSTYSQPISRIKWVVQEDLLIGRITYERVADTDHKGAGPASTDGVISVAFKIQSHFDIRRDYNSTTGEETNVIVENTTDRPWNEREYMRVDWSKNLNSGSYDFDILSMMGIGGAITFEPLSYYINDPNDPNAPHFDADAGYFDVTTKAFASPQMIDLSQFDWAREYGITKYPACYLDADFMNGSSPSGSCDPVELTIRNSFKRVVDKDYEPVDWDGYRFSAYGGFYTDRYGYARDYGMSDQKWYRFLDRYNIWERSHFYTDSANMKGQVACFTPQSTLAGQDPHRDMDGDGTEDECAAVGRGSKCDTFKQRCTLPYRDRKEVPAVWYYTQGSNPEFFDGTDWASHEWDVAMRAAVMTARYTECMSTALEACGSQRKALDACTEAGTCVGEKDAYNQCKSDALAAVVAPPCVTETQQFDACKKAGVCGGEVDAYYTCWAKAPTDPALTSCAAKYPMYTGQMDDNADAIALAREVDDCRHGKSYQGKDCDKVADQVGAARNYTPGVIAIAKMREMIVFCHSPVQADDPVDCGSPRLPVGMKSEQCSPPANQLDDATRQACQSAITARLGDLRYHQVNAITSPQTPSPWGIMVDADDPLSGEKVQASINIWTHVNDLASQGVVDTARYIKGELKTSDVTDGKYVRDWTEASKAAGGGSGMTLTKGDVEQRIASAMGIKAADLPAAKAAAANMDPAIMAKLVDLKQRVKAVRADAKAPSAMAPIYAARRHAAAGSYMEAELVTPAMQQYAGVERLPMSAAVDFASPLRGANPTFERELRRMREQGLADRHACILNEAPSPFTTTAIADLLEEKFGSFNPADDLQTQMDRAEKMRKYVAQRFQYGVIIHEMGHSIGLRHNFISSYDAFSFRPQYWQLRTKNGTVTKPCGHMEKDPNTGKPTFVNDLVNAKEAESCVDKRYFDPVTESERKNLIWAWQQDSVMEYPGDQVQDMMGLASWDFGAARMFYSGAVAVFSDPTYNIKQLRGTGVQSITDTFGGIIGLTFGYGALDANGNIPEIHYTQLQTNYEMIKDCTPVEDPMIFKPASWNDARDGQWNPLLDGQIVQVDNKYSRCRQQPVDYVDWNHLRPPTAKEGANAYQPHGGSVDGQGRTRVPYGFATDSWADLGNLSVYRHDNGADPYELFDFLITQPEVNSIFDNYRRHRQSFSVRSAAGRIRSRYMEKIRDAAKGLGLYINLYRDQLLVSNAEYAVGGFFPENILAAGMAFDTFARQTARPEPGLHLKTGADPVYRWQQLAPGTLVDAKTYKFGVVVPDGATGYYGNVAFGGKLLENQLSSDQGEYDSTFTMNAGSYYDKAFAAMLMTESVDNFISSQRDDFFDARYRSVSVADVFPDGFRRWLANNLTDDDELKGAHIEAQANGRPKVCASERDLAENPAAALFPCTPIGWTSWWPADGPEACFPGEGSTVCSSLTESGHVFNPTGKPGDSIPMLVLDPQVGFEQQKHLIAMTLAYLPENQQQWWLDMLGLWEMGTDTDPGFANRIELHLPNGKVYVAKTFGTETIFGKTVQKGIAARMLEWGNYLVAKAYKTTPGPDLNNDGQPDWVIPALNAAGEVQCTQPAQCITAQHYEEVPFFLRQSLRAYGLADPTMKGIYN